MGIIFGNVDTNIQYRINYLKETLITEGGRKIKEVIQDV